MPGRQRAETQAWVGGQSSVVPGVQLCHVRHGASGAWVTLGRGGRVVCKGWGRIAAERVQQGLSVRGRAGQPAGGASPVSPGGKSYGPVVRGQGHRASGMEEAGQAKGVPRVK